MANVLINTVAGAVLFGCAALAQAQYGWIDAKGIKQYSDRPPPTSIPLKNIFKAPKGQLSADNPPPAEAAPAAALPSAPAPATPSKAAPTLAEREADYVKRQKTAAEQEKKARDDKANAGAAADNCERARSARRTLDSGTRISTTDADGEKAFMDDAQRAAESARVDRMLAACPG